MNSISNIFLVEPDTSEQSVALKAFIKALKIKFKIIDSKKSYNEEFVSKIKKSREEIKHGQSTKVDKKDLSKFLGL